MVYRGRIINGTIVLDSSVRLPEGAVVEVVLTEQQDQDGRPAGRPIEEEIAEIAASVPPTEWDRLPADLSDRLDYYIYGIQEEWPRFSLTRWTRSV
jgi:hypothetical protein